MSLWTRASGVWVGNFPAVVIVADCCTGCGNCAAGIFRRPGTSVPAVCGADAFATLDERKNPRAVNEDRLDEFFLDVLGGLRDRRALMIGQQCGNLIEPEIWKIKTGATLR
jgi:hypothetical protein